MAALLAWFGTFLTGVTGVLTSLVGRKFGLATLYGTVWLGVLAVLTVAVNGLLDFGTYLLPSAAQSAFSMMPANIGQCVGAVAATYLASWVYTFHMKLLHLKVQA